MTLPEYPKWVKGVLARNAKEEAALIEDRAVLKVTHSAQGDTTEIASITPPYVPPPPEPPAVEIPVAPPDLPHQKRQRAVKPRK